MTRTLLWILACSLGLMSEGCASIITKGVTKLSFDSNPSGAIVRIDGKEVGTTPLAVNVSKKASGTVVFSKDGYKPAITQLEKSFNLFFLGNFILGGLFGSTTDVATGAVFEYQPKHYFATLAPGRIGRAWARRAGLARAMASRPELVLLDNPLEGLDPVHLRWWRGFLAELVHGHPWLGGKPATVVIATDELRPLLGIGTVDGGRWKVLGDREAMSASDDPAVRELMDERN